LTVARKRTPGTDVYRLRMIGNLQYPLDVVDAVLNNTELRLKWDKGLTSVEACLTIFVLKGSNLP